MPSRKGKQNKSTREVKAIIDAVSEARAAGSPDRMTAAVTKLFDLADGVMVEGEESVFRTKPDVAAIRTLLEFRFGRPKETMEIQDDSQKLKGVPQVILVPPKWWVTKHGKGK